MKKRVLGVLLCTIILLLLMTSRAFASTTVDNATYAYGSQTDTMRISEYENTAYNDAMYLLTKTSDLSALLSSGNGTKTSPFIVNNFTQLRLLIFWMNMSDCDTTFQFMKHSTSVVVSKKWKEVATACKKDPDAYDFDNVYIKLGSNITGTVDETECSSLFERGINVEKKGEGLYPFLNVLNSATVNLDLNGKSINVTLSGSPKTCSGLALLSGTTATLNISNGSVTVDSNVKYKESAKTAGIGEYAHHFYIANFRKINAKKLTLKANNTSGTSAFIFKGTIGTVESCNMSYVRNKATEKYHYEENVKGGALKFRDQITLTDSTFTCTSPNRGGSVRTVESGLVKMERTNLPEGLFAEGTEDVSIERAEIGGDTVISFIGHGSKVKLDFVNVLNDGEIRIDTPSDKNYAYVQINNCSAGRYRDNDHVEMLTINNSTFESDIKVLGSEIKAKNVTVHGSAFVINSPGYGAIDFKRTASYYNSIKFTDTQMVNKSTKYVISLPALPGYKTAKDEFGDEYVVEYPSTDQNISFRGCSFSVKPGGMYIYQDPANINFGSDTSDEAKAFIGLKLATQKLTSGAVSYVNGSGTVVTKTVGTMNKSVITDSGKNNTSAFLSQYSSILSKADTTLSSIVVNNDGVSKYTLTYNSNSKASFKYDNISQTQYTDGTVKIAYGAEDFTPVSSYYKFKGWAKSPTATTPDYKKGDTINLTSNTVLYAVWAELQPVKYDLNGGTDKVTGVTGSDMLKLEPGTIKVNRAENGTTPIYTPVKEGKYFAGWSTNCNPIKVMYEDGEEATIELDEHGNTLVFYAVWSDHGKTIRVTIQNKDEGTYTAYTQYSGTSFVMPKGCPAPAGKKFVRWYDKTNEKYYYPGDEYVIGEKDTVIVPKFDNIPDSEIVNTISTVNITGVATPVEEATCVTDGQISVGSAANYKAQYAGGTSTWHYTDSKGYTVLMNSTDTFKANVFYTVNIKVTPTSSNYTFDSDTVFKINNTAAKVVSVSGNTYTIAATFRCDEGNLIRDLNITGFIYPLAGNTVQSEGVTVASANGSSTSTITSMNVIVKWYEGTNTTPLSSTSKFETGKVYHAELTVGSNSMLRKFAKNLTVKVNGSVPAVKEVKVSTNSTTKCEVATFVLENMSVDKEAISYCYITGVPDPWANSEAEYPSLTCSTDQYTARVTEWIQKDGTGREREIYATGVYKTFFDTAKAKACVEITPKSGYALASNPTVIINGKTATFDGSYYWIELDVKKPEAITSLHLTGVPELIEGEMIDFNPQVISKTPHTKAAINTYDVSVEDSSAKPIWTETNVSTYREKVISEGAAAKRNSYYSLYVEVTHDTEYTWDTDLNFKITINDGGIYWTDYVGDFGNTRVYKLTMEIKSTESACSHSDKSVVNASEATCTTDGHTGKTVCNNCGKTVSKGSVIPAIGHREVTDDAVAPTCLDDGLTEGKHCSVCGDITVAQMTDTATGHNYVASTTTATCTEDGVAKISCDKCGLVVSEIVTSPATGHTPVNVPAVAATCTTAGRTAGTKCSVCTDVLSGMTEIPAGHTVVTDAAVSATYDHAGKTKGSHCSKCGTVIVAQTTIAKKTLAKTNITSITNTASGIKLKWKKVTGATSYKVYCKAGTGKWKVAKTTSKASYTNKKLKNGKQYQYKVVAVRADGGKTYKSKASAVKTMYCLTKPTLTKETKNISKKIVVKWKKNKMASGYEVKYVQGSTSKIVKVKGAKKVTTTISKLKKGKTYKIYVRSYKTVKGKTYYSAYSKVKKVKVTK